MDIAAHAAITEADSDGARGQSIDEIDMIAALVATQLEVGRMTLGCQMREMELTGADVAEAARAHVDATLLRELVDELESNV